MAGFGDKGLEIKTIEEILADIQQDQLSTIHPTLNVSSSFPLGQMNGVSSRRDAELWELAQYVWNSLNPNAARGVALDNAHSLIGLPRLLARRSTIALSLTFDAATTLPAGTIIAVDGQSSNTWQSVNEYEAIAAGTYLVGFESTQEGNVSANPGTITDIQTPTAGLVSATNLGVPLIGRTREEDEAYRLRRIDALASAGESTVDAIRSKLLNIKNVAQAVVIENDTNGIVNGLPPHSLEAIVFDDANQASDNEIAQVMWTEHPGGIEVFGEISANAVDSQGSAQLMHFSRGLQKRIQLSMTVQVLNGWQASQEFELRTAILAAFRSQQLGGDVLSLKYKSIAIAQKNAYNVPVYLAGVWPNLDPNVDIPIAYREIATLADSDLTLTFINIGSPP